MQTQNYDVTMRTQFVDVNQAPLWACLAVVIIFPQSQRTMAENKREGDEIDGRKLKKLNHHSTVHSDGIESVLSCSFYTEDALQEPVIMTRPEVVGWKRVDSEPNYRVAIDRIINSLPRVPSPTPDKEVELDNEDIYQTLMDDHFTTIHPHPEGKENEFVSVVFVYQKAGDEEDYTKRMFYIPRKMMDYIYGKGTVIEFNGITLPKEDQVWRYFTADSEKDREAALGALTPTNKMLVAKVLRLFPETGVLLRPFLRIEVEE